MCMYCNRENVLCARRQEKLNIIVKFNSIQFKSSQARAQIVVLLLLLLFFYFVFHDLLLREIHPLAPIELRVKFKLAQRSH